MSSVFPKRTPSSSPLTKRPSCGVSTSIAPPPAASFALSHSVAWLDGSMISGVRSRGACRITIAFSALSLSAGSPCAFHLSNSPSDERKRVTEKPPPLASGSPFGTPRSPAVRSIPLHSSIRAARVASDSSAR